MCRFTAKYLWTTVRDFFPQFFRIEWSVMSNSKIPSYCSILIQRINHDHISPVNSKETQAKTLPGDFWRHGNLGLRELKCFQSIGYWFVSGPNKCTKVSSIVTSRLTKSAFFSIRTQIKRDASTLARFRNSFYRNVPHAKSTIFSHRAISNSKW